MSYEMTLFDDKKIAEKAQQLAAHLDIPCDDLRIAWFRAGWYAAINEMTIKEIMQDVKKE